MTNVPIDGPVPDHNEPGMAMFNARVCGIKRQWKNAHWFSVYDFDWETPFKATGYVKTHCGIASMTELHLPHDTTWPKEVIIVNMETRKIEVFYSVVSSNYTCVKIMRSDNSKFCIAIHRNLTPEELSNYV